MIAEQLQKTDLFREVELADLQALVERMQEEHYERGAVLFRAGDAGDTMYIIQSGSIRIYMNDESGKEIALTQYTYRLYTGSETQSPDSLIEAKEGAGLAPAYRGLAYIVFERLPLADFGNRSFPFFCNIKCFPKSCIWTET